VVNGLARAGKVVAAVCHGANGLVNATDAEGQPIVKGREVGGHTRKGAGGARAGLRVTKADSRMRATGGIGSPREPRQQAGAVRWQWLPPRRPLALAGLLGVEESTD
jgi:putative intracellular protease/amidase